MRKARTLSLWAAIGLMGGLAGCSTNPATGEDTFTAFMPPAQEAEVGAEEHPKILKEFGGSYDAKDLPAYVTEIGNKLAAVTETPNQKFTFTVLDSPIVNAFALPGGYVYVTRGLLALASNEAELAGVLAHEIGHVVARHSAQRYSRGVLTQVLAGGLSAAIGSGAGDVIGMGANAYMQSFSREHEFEADKLGVRYLSRAGYDPEAMASFLKKLRAHSQLQAELAGRSPDDVDQFDIMATHPRTLDRIEQARVAANTPVSGAPRLEAVKYMTEIDGIMYGDGPENGFVRGAKFIHVPLDFYFEVPDEFSMINQPDAVVAQDNQGATIIFEGAPAAAQSNPSAYLQRGFSKSVQLRDIQTIDINGQKAATGSADVSLKSGTKARLRVVAIVHGKAAFQFLFLIPLDRADSYNVALRRTTYSFRSLTAAEKKKYHALSIKVRAVNPGYTVDTFVKSMAVDRRPEETFDVINGIENGQLPPEGSLVKVIRE
ncbi:M48 family metalloprotease [Thalassospira mesophila]|uniref:Peptidase n=1 Tax=Thalassospira mesophila TaxID=1293891 RepID=A0A1Y2L6P9_9PROT|nr:M48 family metalloprotease [Thalassospira mesophila]OSQ40838.1 peptidase [Thalassospira mesophila]